MNTSDQTIFSPSKIGEMPIRIHRPIPDDARVKQVTVKQTKTGEWYAIVGSENEDDVAEKLALEDVDCDEMVGINVGIIKYAHDTDSTMVGRLNLESEYTRLEREQWTLSRKEEGSQNWRKQRRHFVRKRWDFLHKLSAYYLGRTTSWPSKTLTFTGRCIFRRTVETGHPRRGGRSSTSWSTSTNLRAPTS